MGTQITRILGKEGLHDFRFEIEMGSKITAQEAITLNRMEEVLHSAVNIDKSDDLVKLMERATKSTENLIVLLEGKYSKDFLMHKLLGLDKQLRSIRGTFKVETVKEVELEQHIA